MDEGVIPAHALLPLLDLGEALARTRRMILERYPESPAALRVLGRGLWGKPSRTVQTTRFRH